MFNNVNTMYPASCIDFMYVSMYLTDNGHLKCDAV